MVCHYLGSVLVLYDPQEILFIYFFFWEGGGGVGCGSIKRNINNRQYHLKKYYFSRLVFCFL